MFSPVKQLQLIAQFYNRHPKPESESLDGVLCWHAKVREGEDEAETWLDAKTGFPKKFIVRRGSGRVMSHQFENFSPENPSDPLTFGTLPPVASTGSQVDAHAPVHLIAPPVSDVR